MIEKETQEVIDKAIELYPKMEGGDFKEALLLSLFSERRNESNDNFQKKLDKIVEVLNQVVPKKKTFLERLHSFIF